MLGKRFFATAQNDKCAFLTVYSITEHDYDLRSQDPAELFIKVISNGVLHCSDEFDITDEIIRFLNEKYVRNVSAE